jgi:hypothetical protein
MSVSYILTSDSITVHFPAPLGAVSITRDHARFSEAWSFLASLRGGPVPPDKVRSLEEMVSLRIAIQRWTNDDFKISDKGEVSYQGQALPSGINHRINEMFRAKDQRWKYLANFWIRLSRNPSRQSVHQLFTFLSNKGIPIGPDGYFYCYKGVNADYKDNWSRTFDNSPGRSHWIPRNQVSDDPAQNCAVGFHAGNMSYAKPYGTRLVIIRVDPAHVARVQNDGRGEKIGISAYSVVADATSVPLPDLVWEPGNDKHATNYTVPEDNFGNYGVWIESFDITQPRYPQLRESALQIMMDLGYPRPVAKALFENLPVCIQADVDAETAKATKELFLPKNGKFRQIDEQILVIEVRSLGLGLLEKEEDLPSPAPAPIPEPQTPVREKLPIAPVPTTRKMAATVMPLGGTPPKAPAPALTSAPETSPLLSAATGVDSGAYIVSPPERDLEKLSRTELRIIAKGLGIPKYSKPGAAELRTLIRSVEDELRKEAAAKIAAEKEETAAKAAAEAEKAAAAAAAIEATKKAAAELREALSHKAIPAQDLNTFSREELRAMIQTYKVPYASKLGVGHLRKILAYLRSGNKMFTPKSVEALRAFADGLV